MLEMYTRKLMEYIGDITQVGGIKRHTFSSGKAKGVEALEVNNGNGLQFTVLPDRGLDIANLNFKGISVSFISKTGIVAPGFYNNKDDEWLRSFTGGFLTTCGLTQVGDPCEYNGNAYGLHGPYSNIPAEHVSIVSQWEEEQYNMRISGEVRQAKVQFENLVLRRSISTILGRNEILIEDEITNEGWRIEPFMILYHMNFGYPFLNPDTDIIIPSSKVSGWDELSEDNIHKCLEITEPEENSPELTYYHDVHCNAEKQTKFMLINNTFKPEIAVVVEYNKEVLNNLTQWKYLRKGEYVMALEPCNNLVKGLAYESSRGNLKYIQPGETVKISMKAKFINTMHEMEKERREITQIPIDGNTFL